MRHEFRVGDVISEIGVPRLYVVVEELDVPSTKPLLTNEGQM